MAAPLPVSLTAGTWTLIATAVRSGQVTIKNNTPSMYKITYVLTGVAAPMDDTTAHRFIEGSLPISASEDIDVYVKAVGADGLLLVEV